MLLLAVNAAIFHKFASGTFHQFDVVNFSFVARGTHLILLFAVHDYNDYWQSRAPRIIRLRFVKLLLGDKLLVSALLIQLLCTYV